MNKPQNSKNLKGVQIFLESGLNSQQYSKQKENTQLTNNRKIKTLTDLNESRFFFFLNLSSLSLLISVPTRVCPCYVDMI